MREKEKDLSSAMYPDRSRHGKSTWQSAMTVGRIEEVVTNKVAGERRRVVESKNDGPPLVAAQCAMLTNGHVVFILICKPGRQHYRSRNEKITSPNRLGVR